MVKTRPIKVIAVRHPVDNAQRDIHDVPYHRQKLSTLCRRYMPNNEDLIVHVNQNQLTKAGQKTYRPGPGDEVVMVPALRAGLVEGIGAVLSWVGAAAAGEAGIIAYLGVNVAIAGGAGYLISTARSNNTVISFRLIQLRTARRRLSI